MAAGCGFSCCRVRVLQINRTHTHIYILRRSCSVSAVMMILFGLFLVASAASLVQGNHEEAKAMVEECAKAHSIETEKIKEYFEQHKLPETENGKCFLQCMVEKSGVVANGKINAEKAKELNAMKLKDKPDLLAKADQMVDACKGLTETGKCELSTAFLQCTMKEAEKMGLKPSDFHDMKN